MLFSLKKTLMGKAIERRNAQHPFDFSYAESYSLDATADPLVNNSYYFSAHGEDMSIYARLGRRVNMEETWFTLYLDGKIYSLKQETFPAGKAPVLVENKGNGSWTVSYEGVLNEDDRISFQGTFKPRQAPIDFTTNMPSSRMAIGMANERWSRGFFAQLQAISGQCHYEQEGTLEGTMTLNGRTLDFSLPCVRDHSFGKRDWNYMNNHLWLMAVSDPVQLNYSLVSYPAISVLEVGNFRDAAGQHYMLSADLDFQQIKWGTVPAELALNVNLDDGRTIPVSARVLAGVTYRFQEGRYILHENIARFTIDETVCRGILEIGFNADGSRLFNHRALEGIRR